MTTIVWGHGSRSRGEEKTFVPAGTTIKWYADLDQNLLTRNGFLALSSGDFGRPTDSQGPGNGTRVEIFNYEVFEDLAKRDRVAILHRGDSALQFVGAEVAEGPLCSEPAACRRAGAHSCDGLLGTVRDSEIVILVCRGLPGGDADTHTYGSDPVTKDIDDDFNAWYRTWRASLSADPDAAMAAFATYSDPVKLQLATYLAVEQWQALHWASVYAANADPASAMTQFRDLDDFSQFAGLLADIPVYRQRFSDAVKADPAGYVAALDNAPQGARDALAAAIPDFAGLQNLASADQAHADFAAESWVPSDDEIAGVNEINAATVKDADDREELDFIVAGFVLLVGDRHGANWTDWARERPDHAEGTITVKRATFGAGKFEVLGCPPAKQSIVENALNAFSDKDVKFV